MADSFDRLRGQLWDIPGFKRRASTIVTTLPLVGDTSTFVVETIRTEEGYVGFLQAITPTGTFRLVLPDKVLSAMYRHHDSIVAQSKSERAKRASETRKAKGVIPFKQKEA